MGTKPCVFPCEVALANSERYLVCAAGAGTIVWLDFVPAWFLWLQGAVGSFVGRSGRVKGNLESVVVDRGGIALKVLLPCAERVAGLRRDVAKCIVMATWMLLRLSFGR